MRFVVFGLAVIMTAMTSTAVADFIRCGNDLVQKGDHVSAVHSKCGQPLRTTQLENEFGAMFGKRELYSDVCGSRDRLVTYRDERVVRIDILR